MEHNEEYVNDIIKFIESKLATNDQNFIRELNNWATDRGLIYLINQWVNQITSEAIIIEKSRNKKELSSLIKEKERFNRILERAEKISKKSLERVYKEYHKH